MQHQYGCYGDHKSIITTWKYILLPTVANWERTPQTQSQVIKPTETFLYGFSSSAAGHFIQDTFLQNADKPVTVVYVYDRSNLFSVLFVHQSDRSVILCIAPLYFHLDMNYWLHRSLQSLSHKLEDESRFQYHKYGVCLHFRGTDIIILSTRAVTAGHLKNLHLRLPQYLSNYQRENCRRKPAEIL